MAALKKSQKMTSLGEDPQKPEPCAWLVGAQTGVATVDNVRRVLKKNLKLELPEDSEIPLLGVYPKEPRAGS